MKTQPTAAGKGGAPVAAGGTWPVVEPAGEPPQRTFRRVFLLRFEVGQGADRLAFDDSATVFKAAFLPYEYDALSPDVALFQAKKEAKLGGVMVTLDAPRLFRSVLLSSSVNLDASARLGLHRVDGQALSEEPTVAVGGSVAGRFRVPQERFTMREVAPGGLPAAPRANIGASGKEARAASERLAHSVTLPATPPFTDVCCVLKIEDGTLAAGEVLGVGVESPPAAPRLGLPNRNDPQAVAYFWTGTNPPVPAVDAGKELAQALQRWVDELVAQNVDADQKPLPLPNPVEVPLVVVSDAPCQLQIEKAEIAWHLVKESFPDRAEKQVLRFGGGRIEAQEACVELPAGATVTSARLEVAPSLRGGQRLAAGAELPGEAARHNSGVYVGQERWAAQSLPAAPGTAVSGLALGLMALSAGTVVAMEVREDVGGEPAGRTLAEGSLPLEGVGEGRWAILRFDAAVMVPAAAPWLLVKVSQGQALWLGEEGDRLVRVLEPRGRAAWSEVGAHKRSQALVLLSPGTGQAQAGLPLAVTVGGQAMALAPKNPQDARSNWGGDLVEALNKWLTAPGRGPGPQTIGVVFRAGVAGLVTVYPPYIEYDLKT